MAPPTPHVLVVECDRAAADALAALLREHGFEVQLAHQTAGALAALDAARIDGLVVAWSASGIDGHAILRRALERNPGTCAVALTDPAVDDGAMEAMRLGAYDVQSGPVHPEKLLAVLRRGVSDQARAARVAELEVRLDERFDPDRLIGHAPAIARVIEQVRQIASTRATVLIEGERGTGKAHVAQAIHHHSPRRGEPFVTVDCGSPAEGELERALFGDVADAFAGAPVVRPGWFERADGGTLFLDGIGGITQAVQVKLLRVLQDRSFERVGGGETVKVDVRLIAATDRDLVAEVGAGRFREDLLYRLGAVRVHVPPLRDRHEDVPLLAAAFLQEFNRQHRRTVTGFTRGALERLMRYPWPGNVRELRNAIEGMVVFAQGRRALDLSDLPAEVRGTESAIERLELTVGMTVEEAERRLLAATLRHTGNDKPRAAALLGIGLRTLYRKIRQYGLG